ncbi:hypothetical protein [Flavobacterium sp. ACN6]|uniref:hypothetical protein n=1 Tax=Flavobacterium sp. ACN6 TaxID=1920426 RepID=UPI000BB3936F|nr:hypothetical protein [Flavobacterium sp. ACN6]PBJ14601.1 hypothetical protein BSF42_10230 [Flavobacterium sp. ACN6]
MKKLEEVQKRFVDVLKDKFYNKEIPPNLNFNQYLDIGRAILSGLLQHLLEKNDWKKIIG